MTIIPKFYNTNFYYLWYIVYVSSLQYIGLKNWKIYSVVLDFTCIYCIIFAVQNRLTGAGWQIACQIL